MNTKLGKVAAVLISLSLLLNVSGCAQEAPPPEVQTIKVDTDVAAKMDITKYAGYVGSVKAIDEQAIMATLPKTVTAVYVTPGQRVEKGQILVRLDSSKLNEAVQQAEAGLSAAKAGLTTAKAALEANMVQRQTALNNYTRIQELHQMGAISDIELEGAKAQYDMLNTGAAEAGVAQAEAGVAQAEAAVAMARQNLADCEITSPINSVVGLVNVEVGETASVTSPIVVLSNTENLEIEVKVSESDVSYIIADTQVKVKIDAIGQELTGTIKSVASVANSVTRTYPVKITFPNTAEFEVKSGMFAEVILATERRAEVLAIPMIAVLSKNGENIVYVVNDQKKAEGVVVKTGLNDGTYTEIVEGLLEGQTVITRGNTLIDETSVLEFADGGTAQ